jgi:C-terminal processing protease CtpA/Prc
LVFGLPGGGMARICVKRDVYADGREFVGRGIRPNIEVTVTVEDFRAGRDAALARAVQELGAQ